MTTRGSDKVAKRRTAAQRVQAKLAEQVARLTEAVNDAMVAAEEKAAALAAVESADDDLRVAVARLAELGESHESIAELADLDVTEVRALRRPKRSEQDGEDQAAVAPAASSPRRPRGAAAAPFGYVPPTTSAGGDGEPVVAKEANAGAAADSLAATG